MLIQHCTDLTIPFRQRETGETASLATGSRRRRHLRTAQAESRCGAGRYRQPRSDSSSRLRRGRALDSLVPLFFHTCSRWRATRIANAGEASLSVN